MRISDTDLENMARGGRWNLVSSERGSIRDLAADLKETRRQLEAYRAWAAHPEVTGALQLAWLHGWRESEEYQALCRATEESDG